MARAATPAAARLLRAALLLLVLVAAGRRAAGAPVVTELRCQCLQTLQGIHLKNIQSVKVTPPGPHCGQTEVVATLKTGQEVCLNPEAPMVKKIINKMLNKYCLPQSLMAFSPENRTLGFGQCAPLRLSGEEQGICSETNPFHPNANLDSTLYIPITSGKAPPPDGPGVPSAPPPALTRLLAPPVRCALGNLRLERLAPPPSPVGAEPGLQLRGPERREVAPLFWSQD
ncbi:PREDICTED: uncharacterized protein LOC103071404 [Lipotes vexillifer]|uniref:C-X-C motif chemokine n=1 Tax=Lipotes vexillifer TaxID=118797 RepID=A0A340XVB1_LIPVE|nr:PREDICTED: uncharacterized protein LOC103071404 [Lipotes vexillifer]